MASRPVARPPLLAKRHQSVVAAANLESLRLDVPAKVQCTGAAPKTDKFGR